MKIYLCQISPNIGDLKGNVNLIKQEILIGNQNEADVVVFPELATIGYPPRDLLYDHKVWESHEKYVQEIANLINSLKNNITVIFGGLHQVNKTHGQFARYNAAYIIDKNYGTRIVHKKLLPSYDVFFESLYFTPGEETSLPIPINFKTPNGIETSYCDILICEDMWNFKNRGSVKHMLANSYSRDPVSELKGDGPIFIVNASPFWSHKVEDTLKILHTISGTLKRNVIWVNQVGGYDELVFGGYSVIYKANGIFDVCNPFKEDRRLFILDTLEYARTSEILQPKNSIYSHGFCGLAMPKNNIGFIDKSDFNTWCILNALKLGLKDYCARNGFSKIVFGCSGGIDSALVGAIASEALGPANVTGITMPSKFSSEGSWKDSERLAKNCGFNLINWNIKNIHDETRHAIFSHEKMQFKRNVTDENLMPRIRALLLMAYSNDEDALLISTGNKSELAVGYCTIYGDMAAGYALLGDVWKTQVYELARFINKHKEIIPESIINKAPSAELSPNQKDTDTLPPYEQLDPLLIDLIELGNPPHELYEKYGKLVVDKIVLMYDRSEFKRRQSPPIPKINIRSFGTGRDIPISKKI